MFVMGIFEETVKINISEVIEDLMSCTTSLTDARSLDPLMKRIGEAKYVLLGESTHGTHEYYLWRTKISQRLIQEKGFSYIAVEGDWPDCYKLNRYVKGKSKKSDVKSIVKSFNRWPTWMWGNWETVALAEWLKRHNDGIAESHKKVGFYGLDVYSLWESMESIVDYLTEVNSPLLSKAQEVYTCFKPYSEMEGSGYARQIKSVSDSCRSQVVSLLTELRKSDEFKNHDAESMLNLFQNAEIAVSAELYYRSMLKSGPSSWNIRDRHMLETLNRVSEFYGSQAKGIIWEHNTHIGDARATDMHLHGMYNLGQLIREQYGKNEAVLIGLGSYRGSLMAGYGWGEPMVEMTMPEAMEDSWEELLHNFEPDDKLLILDNLKHKAPFNLPINHRAIGVVYDPRDEKSGNYVPSIIPERYDAFLFIDETNAIHPLNIKVDEFQMPDTYPWKE